MISGLDLGRYNPLNSFLKSNAIFLPQSRPCAGVHITTGRTAAQLGCAIGFEAVLCDYCLYLSKTASGDSPRSAA